MRQGLGLWRQASLVAIVLIPIMGCSQGNILFSPPSPTVSSSRAQGISGTSSQNPATSASASKGKAFPVLGVEIAGETTSIRNGQRLSLGDGLFGEVLTVPFPPTPETELHLFLLAGEKPVKGAEITVIYDMVDMDHGAKDRQIGREVEEGHYAVPLDLFMYGDWAADVTISHPRVDATLRVLLGVLPWKKKS